MEPWGTPNLTSARFNLQPLIETNCFLLTRYDANHLFEIPLTP